MRSVGLLVAALLALGSASAQAVDVKVCAAADKEYLACMEMVKTFFSGGGGAEGQVEEDDDMGGDDTGPVSDDGRRRRSLLASQFNWECVKPAAGEDSVLEMISTGACNFGMDMDAHDVYDANKDYGFEAIAAEDYTGSGKGLTYYGVAVVPASVCEANPKVSLADLKGSRSCHTGYKRTSGWTIPLASIVSIERDASGVEAISNKKDYEIMLEYFPQMCAPSGPEEVQDQMCANCIGDCKRDSDPYSGYAGSLRCLMEGGGDVAFMKETTSQDYAADGNDPQPWSSVSKADLKLVCPDGGCADVDDFDGCNYARIPSHMVAVSAKELPVDEIRAAFMDAASTPAFANWLSTKPALFKAGTKGMVPIQEDTITYMGRLVDVYAILEDLGYY
ncbi:transferrin-like domain-containing protein [Chloropicon primus]|nr:transferrin-like domain-containing protein [Chloropicon primus]UPQ98617.1 transferrin-like domain-containing protein [Chloropicon primus]|eukprot:QDZ19408.1 transferrin-like domain-containing protein [Chloropicon primus]